MSGWEATETRRPRSCNNNLAQPEIHTRQKSFRSFQQKSGANPGCFTQNHSILRAEASPSNGPRLPEGLRSLNLVRGQVQDLRGRRFADSASSFDRPEAFCRFWVHNPEAMFCWAMLNVFLRSAPLTWQCVWRFCSPSSSATPCQVSGRFKCQAAPRIVAHATGKRPLGPHFGSGVVAFGDWGCAVSANKPENATLEPAGDGLFGLRAWSL